MIVISRDLVLSGGFAVTADNPVIGYENAVTVSNIAATYQDSDYPASNLANGSSVLKWASTEIDDQTLTLLLSEARDVDYVAVAAHNFGAAGIPVTVEVESEGVWTAVCGPVLPADDAPLIMRFASALATGVRLIMGAGSEPPQAAVLYAGSLLTLPRRIYGGHTPMPLGRTPQIANGISENGNFLGRIVTGGRVETAVELAHLDPAWYRATFAPFVKAAAEKPFFFAWRPGSYPSEVGYGWLTKQPIPVNSGVGRFMQVDLSVAGIV